MSLSQPMGGGARTGDGVPRTYTTHPAGPSVAELLDDLSQGEQALVDVTTLLEPDTCISEADGSAEPPSRVGLLGSSL